ncbi:molybdopterin molybdenumtransferase MoeA [Niveispirillum lacus]|uniref:Molybdopterin molybdenumtransferase n=1 Tax=Niveispirillum lacus TaxID=1981099 RepID=A0A255YWA0_9PROT|nr:gephyrin-like molybdotransferase Glp [Niveispirillum lacus]OYQ33513.1 molybdopterin molybdenumtransferase MoeA [Niveispirillum lacus]
MIPLSEARARILAAAKLLPAEQVPITQGLGRVLAADVVARVTHPPTAVSAMDGWAVRTTDISAFPVTLTRIGEAPAGRPFTGHVGPGQAVRIFTGGALPDGADTVVVQEDADDHGAMVTLRDGSGPGRWVRPAGQDFATGDVGVAAGRRLTVRDLALAASMNVPWLRVRRRPRVSILATGDEVVMPGDTLAPGQIVSSNSLALCALVRQLGGAPVDLGIAGDSADSLSTLVAAASGTDLLVTIGGASVGEHDLVRAVLGAAGLELDFWKIAMRPGKPLMFGQMHGVPMVGLPGNPVSALVCAWLFLRPLLLAMQGLPTDDDLRDAILARDMGANDSRADFIRARLSRDGEGRLVAEPFPKQDSGMLSRLAWADCLILRAPHAPPAKAGDRVQVMPLDGL